MLLLQHSARIFGSRPKNLSLFGFTPSLPPCIRTGGEISNYSTSANFAVALGTVLVPSTSTCCRSGILPS